MNLLERALRVMPGGVNSPVRAFRSVGVDPIFIKSGKGSKIYDVDGKEYIDYISSWGPMIYGHANDELTERGKEYFCEGMTFGLPTEIEVEMAEHLCEACSMDMVRMVNSGTEATMSAIRLARGYTGRDLIVKFEGCYHGHSDCLLVKSGSGTLTYNEPTSAGVLEDIIKHTIVLEYNNIEALARTVAEHGDAIAAVIIEPVAGNMGVVAPDRNFITELRRLTQENGILLIFDEVITGFRLRYGSISSEFGIKPDLFCFGKIIGGGLPVGCYGGRRDIMEKISPLGPVYQAGTLSGNPLAMKMGLDTLKKLRSDLGIYDLLEKKAKILAEGFEKNISEVGIDAKVIRFKSMLCLFFGKFEKIKSYDDVKHADTYVYAQYFRSMLADGIIMPPAQFEGIFISAAHSNDDLKYTIEKNREALIKVKKYLQDKE